MDFIAEKVSEGLTSLALEEFKMLWNAKDDAEKMKKTVLAIKATLLDAEAKATNRQVGIWLQSLKDVLYDADGLLDDLSTEALTREIITRNKMAKKVRIFFSKSNQVLFNLKMGHKMKDIRGKLDNIEKEKNILGLIDNRIDLAPIYKERKQTHSYVPEDEIIGREEDRDLILRYLLDHNVKSRFSVIPIVGLGGLGKTALAQLVYNHEDVQCYFELKKWVCVSNEFDLRQIAQKILGEVITTKEMEQVQNDVRELIKGKRFLIVLDDVWNEEIRLWDELKKLLKEEGAAGSMVIVTTRSNKVGKIMGTYDPIILKSLDDKKSWKLFCQMAFEGGKEPANMEEREIAREIVDRCAGVPLAIRCIGSLLHSLILEGIDWSYLRDSELWTVDHEENKIYAILKLSYDHLPSPLKHCVAFCSLFPKDFQFEKQTLIQLWVAEGFIQPSNQMRCEEDVGHEYFTSLVSKSFFQDVKRDKFGDIWACKMHDLMHDLAHFVAKDEYLDVSERKEKGMGARHLSYNVSKDDLTPFLKSKQLKTMLLARDYNYELARIYEKIPSPVLRQIHSHAQVIRAAMLFKEAGARDSSSTSPPAFDARPFVFNAKPAVHAINLITSNFKYLRVLVLCSLEIEEVPKSIGKLKHLRFLDLSDNRISQLPRVLTSLHNLQTLKLSDNSDISELPRDIDKLVSLRHIELKGCRITWMPQGLEQLTSLQTLTHFAIADKKEHERKGCAGISELGALNNLSGVLQIKGLEQLRVNPQEAESAKLQEKRHLYELVLVWVSCKRTEASNDESILERLRSHHAIKSLVIKGFCGTRLPRWIANLSSLQELEMSHCKYLASLPKGLLNLPSLQRVRVKSCPELNERSKKIVFI